MTTATTPNGTKIRGDHYIDLYESRGGKQNSYNNINLRTNMMVDKFDY